MSSAGFRARVKSSVQNLMSEKTLIELTNQRAGEAGLAKPTSINDTVLDEAILLAAAEVEEHLSEADDTDHTDVKLVAELVVSDLCVKHAINPTSMGFANKKDIMDRVMLVRKARVNRGDRIDTDDKETGWVPPSSGFNPFDI